MFTTLRWGKSSGLVVKSFCRGSIGVGNFWLGRFPVFPYDILPCQGRFDGIIWHLLIWPSSLCKKREAGPPIKETHLNQPQCYVLLRRILWSSPWPFGPAKTWKKTTSPPKSLRIPYVTRSSWISAHLAPTPGHPLKPLGHPYTRAHEEYKV